MIYTHEKFFLYDIDYMSSVVNKKSMPINIQYNLNNKPPPFIPPPNNKINYLSPQLNWLEYENETPPQFYLNQKFDNKKKKSILYG